MYCAFFSTAFPLPSHSSQPSLSIGVLRVPHWNEIFLCTRFTEWIELLWLGLLYIIKSVWFKLLIALTLSVCTKTMEPFPRCDVNNFNGNASTKQWCVFSSLALSACVSKSEKKETQVKAIIYVVLFSPLDFSSNLVLAFFRIIHGSRIHGTSAHETRKCAGIKCAKQNNETQQRTLILFKWAEMISANRFP